MTALTFLPIVALLAGAYAVLVIAAEQSVERAQRRRWHQWQRSLDEARRLRRALERL